MASAHIIAKKIRGQKKINRFLLNNKKLIV
jgi:hypothetical protein